MLSGRLHPTYLPPLALSHQSDVFRVEPVLTDAARLHVRLLRIVGVRVGPVTAAVHPLVVVVVPVVFVYNVSVRLEATSESAELGIAAIAAEVTFAVESLHLRPKVASTLKMSLYAISEEPEMRVSLHDVAGAMIELVLAVWFVYKTVNREPGTGTVNRER